MAKARGPNMPTFSTEASIVQPEGVLIDVPLASHYPPTEFLVHVDTRLTLEQSSVVRRIARQLDLQQAYLKNGQRVINTNAAIKWLLEQVAQELEHQPDTGNASRQLRTEASRC